MCIVGYSWTWYLRKSSKRELQNIAYLPLNIYVLVYIDQRYVYNPDNVDD